MWIQVAKYAGAAVGGLIVGFVLGQRSAKKTALSKKPTQIMSEKFAIKDIPVDGVMFSEEIKRPSEGLLNIYPEKDVLEKALVEQAPVEQESKPRMELLLSEFEGRVEYLLGSLKNISKSLIPKDAVEEVVTAVLSGISQKVAEWDLSESEALELESIKTSLAKKIRSVGK